YVFFLPSLGTLVISIVVAGVALAGVWRLLPDAAAFWPVTLLALPACAVALLATPARAYAPPWIFLFFDLRWWFLAGIVILVGSSVGSGVRVRRSAEREPVRRSGTREGGGGRRTIPIVLLATL